MSTRTRDLLFGAGLRHEPVEKRVRADDAVDSTRAVLVWEPRRVTPLYAVPENDIAVTVEPGGETVPAPEGVLHPGIPFAAHTAPGDPVSVGGRAGAGFRLADPDLAGHVLLDFYAFDAWREEDEAIRGHPRENGSRGWTCA